MKYLNWFKINIFANIATVLFYILAFVFLRFDPGYCHDGGLCDANLLPPTPLFFTVIYVGLNFIFWLSSVLAVLSLPILIFKKIKKTTATSWLKIFLALIISIPALFFCVAVVEQAFFI